MKDFVGAWRVSEYVYNPDGCFVGIVRQRRGLERLGNGHVRVTQHCQPDETLSNHPMGRFAGSWVFDLSFDGATRLYHGPDVIGSGFAWDAGAMTGRGFWPRFGHSFSSFAVLATPKRQLTGGKFFSASQIVANVVGVAVPEEDEWPELSGSAWLGEVAPVWVGIRSAVDPVGNVVLKENVERTYEGEAWSEAGFTLEFSPVRAGLLCLGQKDDATLQGLAKQVGPMLEGELVMNARWLLKFKEIFDAAGRNLVSLRRLYKDQRLESVEVLHLKPKGARV